MTVGLENASASWGVIGTSAIATNFMIPAIREAGGRVEAIASRVHARATAAAEKLEIGRAHGSYADLLADDRIDAVYIALPNALHAEWVHAALSSGRNVLVEKSLTHGAAEAEALTDLAVRKNLLLMEGYMYRHHPQWQVLVSLLERDLNDGSSLTIRSHLGYRLNPPTGIRADKKLGGGSLLDIGCYAVAAASDLLGKASEAFASVVARDPASGIDLLTVANLNFAGHRAAVIDCDFLFDWTNTPLELRLPTRTVLLDHAYNPGMEPTQVVVYRQGVDTEKRNVVAANAYLEMARRFMRLLPQGAGSAGALAERSRLRCVAHNMELVWNAMSA